MSTKNTKAEVVSTQRKEEERDICVTAPNIMEGVFHIFGTEPYVQLRFSTKTQNIMMEKQKADKTERSKKPKREPRNFDSDYLDAMYQGPKGERGIPAAAFRNALISACRLVGFKMTIAKMSVFVIADVLDVDSGVGLVTLSGRPEKRLDHVVNATGVADIRARAMWREWKATLHLRFDADQFKPDDVTNLLLRAGTQVGVGEGRNDSKKSCGMGCGSFGVDLENISFSPVATTRR